MTGAKTNDTTVINLMRMFMAGEEVS
ncbi:MAG: hypothetical protein H6Q76_1498, partial [Firmicutes bacterium]|nr:hypothetical protein [Bacillota bacterium]